MRVVGAVHVIPFIFPKCNAAHLGRRCQHVAKNSTARVYGRWVRFLQYSASDILLIVDQMNALEPSVHTWNDSLSNDMKKDLLAWRYKITASANYSTRLQMDAKETNETSYQARQ